MRRAVVLLIVFVLLALAAVAVTGWSAITHLPTSSTSTRTRSTP